MRTRMSAFHGSRSAKTTEGRREGRLELSTQRMLARGIIKRSSSAGIDWVATVSYDVWSTLVSFYGKLENR